MEADIEDVFPDEDQVEDLIDDIDTRISKYSVLLHSIRKENGQLTNLHNYSSKSFYECDDHDELPLHLQIYRQNQSLSRSTIHQLKMNWKNTAQSVNQPEQYCHLDDIPQLQTTLDLFSSVEPLLRTKLLEQKDDLEEKQRKLRIQYRNKYFKWREKVDQLESKSRHSTRLPETMSNRGPRGRSAMTSSFTSDAVRSEAEWEAVLASLGIVDQDDTSSRYAVEPAMLLDESDRAQILWKNMNDHVKFPVQAAEEWDSRILVKWSNEDRELFLQKLLQHGKDFPKIASFFHTKTTSDCVQYYYREKVNLKFKRLLRQAAKLRKRPGPFSKKKEDGVDLEMTPDGRISPSRFNESANNSDTQCETPSLAPTNEFEVQNEPSLDVSYQLPSEEETSAWNPSEKVQLIELFEKRGKDFESIAQEFQNKTVADVESFYRLYRVKLHLNDLVLYAEFEKSESGHLSDQDIPTEPGDKTVIEPVEIPYEPLLEPVLPAEETVPNFDEQFRKGRKGRLPRRPDMEMMSVETLDEFGKKQRRKRRTKKRETEETEMDPNATMDLEASQPRRTVSYWSVAEKAEFAKALSRYGRNWEAIAKKIGTKSTIQTRNYYHNYRYKLEFDRILSENGHSVEEDKSGAPPTESAEDAEMRMDEEERSDSHQYVRPGHPVYPPHPAMFPYPAPQYMIQNVSQPMYPLKPKKGSLSNTAAVSEESKVTAQPANSKEEVSYPNYAPRPFIYPPSYPPVYGRDTSAYPNQEGYPGYNMVPAAPYMRPPSAPTRKNGPSRNVQPPVTSGPPMGYIGNNFPSPYFPPAVIRPQSSPKMSPSPHLSNSIPMVTAAVPDHFESRDPVDCTSESNPTKESQGSLEAKIDVIPVLETKSMPAEETLTEEKTTTKTLNHPTEEKDMPPSVNLSTKEY